MIPVYVVLYCFSLFFFFSFFSFDTIEEIESKMYTLLQDYIQLIIMLRIKYAPSNLLRTMPLLVLLLMLPLHVLLIRLLF